jgi:hypothetical protein
MFLAGTAAVAESGAVCTTDFIVIPNPSQNSVSLNTDRFCGNALVPTTSKYSVHYSWYCCLKWTALDDTLVWSNGGLITGQGKTKVL